MPVILESVRYFKVFHHDQLLDDLSMGSALSRIAILTSTSFNFLAEILCKIFPSFYRQVSLESLAFSKFQEMKRQRGEIYF